MRLAPLALLLAASTSTLSICAPRPKRPDTESITKLELHSWAERRRKGFRYWVTTVDVATACASSDSVDDDGIRHVVRDCSFAALLRPRIDELLAVFAETEEPQIVGERLAEDGEGHGAVFVLEDATRWTADSKLLREGAKLLDGDTSEWLLLGPPNQLPPSPEGWTQLDLRDRDGALGRHLASDGRWSCESWLVSEQTLDHVILVRRGRIEAPRAAALLDGFAEGLAPVLAGKTPQQWTATLAPEDQSAAIELQGDELVARWQRFAAELDRDCSLDPPPTAAGLSN